MLIGGQTRACSDANRSFAGHFATALVCAAVILPIGEYWVGSLRLWQVAGNRPIRSYGALQIGYSVAACSGGAIRSDNRKIETRRRKFVFAIIAIELW